MKKEVIMNVNKLAEKIINETNRKDYQHVVYEVVDYLYLNNYLEDRQQIIKMIDEMIAEEKEIEDHDYPDRDAVESSMLIINKLTELRSKL